MADFLIAVTVVTPSIALTITNRMILPEAICQSQAYFALSLLSVSLLTMCLTAIHRYMKVVRPPHRGQILVTKRSVALAISSSWIFSFMFPSIYWAAGRKARFYPGEMLCFFDLLVVKTPGITMSYVIIFGIIIYGTIVFCYAQVYRTVRQHKQRLRARTVQPQGIRRQNTRLSVEELRVTRLLVAVVLSYVICWLPALVLWGFKAYGVPVHRRLEYWGSTMSALSSVINPILYGAWNTDFRAEFKRMLCRAERTRIAPFL
ncbi:beta-3 adrenergic receptor-like [Nematostella vectensis]|uniref:beta-3 adrenergic receptor-like n=1 Tax=Nematostella vectensis TaxID=45351 RepID=UPI002076DE56|nr:beta-3 adrenergic receptor-like [Nematostella vectensis]